MPHCANSLILSDTACPCGSDNAINRDYNFNMGISNKNPPPQKNKTLPAFITQNIKTPGQENVNIKK